MWSEKISIKTKVGTLTLSEVYGTCAIVKVVSGTIRTDNNSKTTYVAGEGFLLGLQSATSGSMKLHTVADAELEVYFMFQSK